MNTTGNNTWATLPLDEEGFLISEQNWNSEVALKLAEQRMSNGITEDHWKVINYMREYFIEYGSVPPVRKLSRDTGISLRELNRLFPEGLTKGACRIAGIPRHVIKPSFLYP